jgi:hypothetical protein
VLRVVRVLRLGGAKIAPVEPLLRSNDLFTKTGSGQTKEKLRQTGVLCAGRSVWMQIFAVGLVRKTPLFERFLYFKNEHFTKTGSGQT